MLKIIVILFDDWDHKNRLVDGLEGLIHVKGFGDFILVLIWKQRQNTIFNCIRDGTLTFQDFASGSVHDDIVATGLLDVVDALGEMSVYRHWRIIKLFHKAARAVRGETHFVVKCGATVVATLFQGS